MRTRTLPIITGAASAALLLCTPALAAPTVTLEDGRLTVAGTAAREALEVRLAGAAGDKVAVLSAIDGSSIRVFDRQAVEEVLVDLAAADDKLTVELGAAGPPTVVAGGPGRDEINTGAGAQVVRGGDDGDVITAGQGADLVDGEEGADTFAWNPGDGNDVVDGGTGVDSMIVNGSNVRERVTIARAGTHVQVARDVGVVNLDLFRVQRLALSTRDADDRIAAGSGLGELVVLSLDGGLGADEITGGDGADFLIGGDGDDIIEGGGAADSIAAGVGTDVVRGDSGDDGLDGGAGHDALAGGAGTDGCVNGEQLISCESQSLPPAPSPDPPAPEPAEPGPAPQPTPPPPPNPSPSPSPSPSPVPSPAPTPVPGPGGESPGAATPIRVLRARPTGEGLRLVLLNRAAADTTVQLAARERGRTYRPVLRTLAGGAEASISLRAPRALRRRLAAALARKRAVRRRPVLAITAGGQTTTLRPRLVMRRS